MKMQSEANNSQDDGTENLSFTDADMIDSSGSGDLGGGRVGGDLGARHLKSGVVSGDDQSVEDEDLVNAAVDDGADIAVADNGLSENTTPQSNAGESGL